MPNRAALYIDGFNLYHSINDLGEDFLKWCNLWALGELIIPSRSEILVKAVFCSAFYPGDHGKRIRHEAYIKALKLVGVKDVMGHYVHEPASCKACKNEWQKPTEKQTDINIALSVYDDAYQDVFDHAYLLTADSDQAATARMLKERFPEKLLTSVSPPGRPHSKNILAYADKNIALSRDHIERCHFGFAVNEGGNPPVMRPKEYEPPSGWVPFDQRPKKA